MAVTLTEHLALRERVRELEKKNQRFAEAFACLIEESSIKQDIQEALEKRVNLLQHQEKVLVKTCEKLEERIEELESRARGFEDE